MKGKRGSLPQNGTERHGEGDVSAFGRPFFASTNEAPTAPFVVTSDQLGVPEGHRRVPAPIRQYDSLERR